MTKIVINSCYGGFSISEQAVLAYAARKGLTVYKDGERWAASYWTIPPEDPGRISFAKSQLNWRAISLAERARANEFYSTHTISTRPEDRTDPDLIAVIEELGTKAASGANAELEIIEIPPGTLYRITEYDGYESLETQENIDWKVA